MKNLLKKLLPKSFLKLYHKTLALFSAFVYGFPSDKLIVIGITGTKGKSSTSNLLVKILEEAGFKVGLSSTICFQIAEKEWINDKKMTMLGRFALQKMLRQMVMAGCKYAVIETSSEGIAQYRHLGINYDVVLFTNLTPEHLESHGGFENYKKAKGKLFSHLTQNKHKIIDNKKVEKVIIANLDDSNAGYFLSFQADKKFGYKIITQENLFQLDSLISASDIRLNSDGAVFSLDSHLFCTNLLGMFNVYNCLAAITVAESQNIDFETSLSALKKVKVIPGRMEFINRGQNFKFIVDYAHEPASLNEMYRTLLDSSILHTDSKIIHILGSAGGGRDKSRREVLGKIAGEKADIVIITNEDPYDDDPNEIIEQVALGPISEGKVLEKDLFKVFDRRQAISRAIGMALANDIVVITGKGSEQAIIVTNSQALPWDDRKVAGEELEKFLNQKKV